MASGCKHEFETVVETEFDIEASYCKLCRLRCRHDFRPAVGAKDGAQFAVMWCRGCQKECASRSLEDTALGKRRRSALAEEVWLDPEVHLMKRAKLVGEMYALVEAINAYIRLMEQPVSNEYIAEVRMLSIDEQCGLQTGLGFSCRREIDGIVVHQYRSDDDFDAVDSKQAVPLEQAVRDAHLAFDPAGELYENLLYMVRGYSEE